MCRRFSRLEDGYHCFKVPAIDLCVAGNKFVVQANRQLLGPCGVDLLPGLTGNAIIAINRAIYSW